MVGATHSRSLLVAAVVTLVLRAQAGSDIYAGFYARVQGGQPNTADGSLSSASVVFANVLRTSVHWTEENRTCRGCKFQLSTTHGILPK